MNSEDVKYLLFLFFSIIFGSYYRKIEHAQNKKKIGALVGFLIVLAVSGLHFIHVLVTILVNSFIITYVDVR